MKKDNIKTALTAQKQQKINHVMFLIVLIKLGADFTKTCPTGMERGKKGG